MVTLSDALYLAADTLPYWSKGAVMVLAALVIGCGHLVATAAPPQTDA